MATRVVFFTTTGAGTYTIPNDFVSLISVEAIGGGGGSLRSDASGGAGGSGGGAYSKSTTMTGLSGGTLVYYNVGTGGTSGTTAGNGGDSWFSLTNSAPAASSSGADGVLAKGGTAAVSGGTAGAGGVSTSGAGDVRNSGGSGGAIGTGSPPGRGGGGGAAGPGGIGGNGSNTANADAGGGGGGGASLTNPGGNASAGTGGNGGGGTGGGGPGGSGVAGTAGTGGGGGGATTSSGGAGGTGSYWTQTSNSATAGSGGGGGGSSAGAGDLGGAGALYGGGSGGSVATSSSGAPAGAQGIIVFTYDDSTRYWVGGTGTWDNTNTTNWSLTSGGAGGASVPTSNTLVIFDANSGSGIVTTAATAAANNITYNSSTLTSLTLGASLNISASEIGQVILTAGTINLAGFTLTCKTFQSSNSNTRAIQFGTGNITTTGSGTAWTTATATNLTYTGTPTVNISNNSATATTVTAGTTGGAFTNAFDFNFTTGTYALTLTTGSVVEDINFTGFTGTWAPGTATCTFFGSLTLVSGMTFTAGSGLWTWANTSGTKVIISAGKTLGPITQNGAGGTVALGDALNIGGNNLTITQGTFTTSASNYNLTANSIQSSNSNTRTITLNGSTITLAAGSNVINFSTSTNLTFNANTSQINLSSDNAQLLGGGQTFNNVTFTSALASGVRSITGVNTFNNLTLTPPTSSTGYVNLAIGANQTISGTFTCSGNSAVDRTFIRSGTFATVRTLTVATLSATDCNFRDITIAGTAAGTAPTRAGDCGGNSGITFPASKTVYWNLAGSQNFASTGWATTSNGTPAVNNYPLPQDIAIFTNDGAAGSIICGDAVGGTLPEIDLSARTSAMTLDFYAGGGQEIYGGFINSANAAVTLTWLGNGILTFRGRKSVTFNIAGRTIPGSGVVIDAPGGTVILASGTTTLSTSATLTRGTLDLGTNTSTLRCTAFSSDNSNTRVIAFGTGNITTTGSGTVWNQATGTGLTYTGTPTVNISNNSATATTITAGTNGGAFTNAFDFNITTGTYALTITNNSDLKSLNFTGFTGSWSPGNNAINSFYGNLTLVSGMTFTPGTGVFTWGDGTGTAIITSAGKTLSPITLSAAGGTIRLADNLTLASTATFTLTQGTLDLGTNTATLSCGLFSSSNSNTRVIAFGTGQITLTGNNATIWNTLTGTNLTWSGTAKIVSNYSGSTGTRTFNFGLFASAPFTVGSGSGNQFSFGTSGTDLVTFSGFVNALDFTGFTGTWAQGSNNLTFPAGNLTLDAGMTCTAGTAAISFTATSGTQVITSAGKTINPVTKSGVGGTLQLADALTTTGTFTLTSGDLDIGTNTSTLTCGAFSSNNSNTRVIAFGTGNITTTGSGTAWTTATATGLTYTGTPTVNISNNSATATTVNAGTTGGAETNAFDFNFTTGSYALTLTTASRVKNLAFTGGTISWSPGTATYTFFGSVTLLAGMTYTTGTGIWTLAGTSGVQTITSAGKTIGPITINNTGTSVQLSGNTTGAALVFAQGTLDINSVTTSFTTLTCATGPSTISGGTLNCTTFTNTSGSTTIQSGTLNLSGAVTHTAGTVTLGTSGILTTPAAYTLTAGTLALESGTVTALTFSSSNSNVRSISFGTGQITLTGNNATIWNTSTATNFTRSGTAKIVSNYSGSTGTRTFNFGSLTVPFTVGSGSGNEFSFGTAGTDTIVFAASSLLASLDFTGFTGTWAQSTNAISITSGNLTLDAGMIYTASTGVISFTATSGTQTITSAGKTINPVTKSGVGGTLQLADNVSINGVTTLTSGTLNLGNNTLSTTTFSSSNSNTRAIQFGTGNITVNSTAGGTVWNTSTSTGLTRTGTPTVNISCNTATATNVVTTTFVEEGSAFDFNFTTGTYNLGTTGGAYVGSFNFTGFAGTYEIPIVMNFYGNLTLVPSMTFIASTSELGFLATSGTQTITSAGNTFYQIVKLGVGGTLSLADDLTCNQQLYLISGTFNANNRNVTARDFNSNYSNTRTLTMGSGTWTLTGTGTVWDCTTSTNLTVNADTSTIVLSNTSTTARTFAGGGLTYNNLTIGGATGISTLSISGNNTFNTLASTKTVAHTIRFGAGTTTTVANWTITGTAGNVVTLNSATPGSQATLAKTGGGVISGIDYLSIQDSAATPASTWYPGANSTNVSNNTGWVFSSSNFFLLF